MQGSQAQGYAREVRSIYDAIKGYDGGERQRLCSGLEKRLRKAWKKDLEAQIAALKGLRATPSVRSQGT